MSSLIDDDKRKMMMMMMIMMSFSQSPPSALLQLNTVGFTVHSMTERLHFHALKKAMATHSSVLA